MSYNNPGKSSFKTVMCHGCERHCVRGWILIFIWPDERETYRNTRRQQHETVDKKKKQ